ncbi:MAG: hypothetical protein ACKV2O_11960 [Acidimicrobiales bacterium]
MAPPRPSKSAAGASSTKKLAKVARSGKKRSIRESSSRAYPLAILAICVVGGLLVFWGRDQRASAQRVEPRLEDHWHVAYGMYLCDAFAPNPVDVGADKVGIHTHDDGIIHIHPFSSVATGEDATLGKFFDQIALKASDTKLTTTDGKAYESGKTTCPSGEVGKLVLARWASADDPDAKPEIITEDITGARFLTDRSAFTLAFVPEGKIADIPRPESIPGLDQLTDVDPSTLTTLPGSASSVAGDPGTTVAGDPAATTTTVAGGATSSTVAATTTTVAGTTTTSG